MHPTNCPICNACKAKSIGNAHDYFECDICKGFHIDPRLVRAPTQLTDYTTKLGAIRELREKYDWAPTLHFDGRVTCVGQDSVEHELSSYPQTIAEKANRLLAVLAKRTTYFGETITLKNSDYGLCYAKSDLELRSILDYLETRGEITQEKTMRSVSVKVSAEVLDKTAQ